MATKHRRTFKLSVWLSQTFWFPASLACAQTSSLCGHKNDELLTPSAWRTIDRSRYLLEHPAELITPIEWSEELVSCRTLLHPFDSCSCIPESELLTPVEWL
jgi:hypothetical protein